MFPSQRWLECTLALAILLGASESLLPSINNLFKGIPFSQVDKIHEHIQVSSQLVRRTKGSLAFCFQSFFEGFRKGLSTESLLEEGPIRIE